MFPKTFRNIFHISSKMSATLPTPSVPVFLYKAFLSCWRIVVDIFILTMNLKRGPEGE